ncbi:hypothetical protein C1645_823689 [Glomus cerebriforme]|uniref:BTB domain-containing protein n=1 Tax=Glomus cerebriforme TaxID=658196 RepID=A0A397SVX7_9GLOM|nr:hypothetical protein C1645_823689 [Glomus cerebriforme]
MDTLKSLPIWPVHSSENKFIDATSGKLLTYKLPSFFSFYQETKFYRRDNESDFNTLIKLGTTSVDELEYVKNHIIPPLFTLCLEPSQEYINFLQSVLSLGNQEIEQCLKCYPVIPNKSLTTFVKVETLYDKSFRNILDHNDKFLLPELQNNSVCLEALKRMGLKYYQAPHRPNYVLQKDALLISLLNQLSRQSDNRYNDVIFIFDGGKELRANSYVLSAASKKFEQMLCDNSNSPIEIEFRQDIFLVFLQLLYGQSLKDAINPILCKASDFETEQKFETYYISFLIDLLKLSVIYEVDSPRIEIEDAIIECQCVSVHNLCKILECLERFDVQQRLRNFYKQLIELNESFINEQLSELRTEISRMSQLVHSINK